MSEELEALIEADEYLVYKGFCGNNPLFWKHNNCGYTTVVEDAKIFTLQDAKKCDSFTKKIIPLAIVKRNLKELFSLEWCSVEDRELTSEFWEKLKNV